MTLICCSLSSHSVLCNNERQSSDTIFRSIFCFLNCCNCICVVCEKCVFSMHLLTFYRYTSSTSMIGWFLYMPHSVAVVPLHTPHLPLLLFALVFPLLLLALIRSRRNKRFAYWRAAVQGIPVRFEPRFCPIVVCASWAACKNTFWILPSCRCRFPADIVSSSLNLSRTLTTSAVTSLYCRFQFSFLFSAAGFLAFAPMPFVDVAASRFP